MQQTRTYLVPDYYPKFQCKIGTCRHSCCDGWPVSISMQDYFYLLGIPCNEKLRHLLDTALHICDQPTEEEYALITPRYDGKCHLRLEDGRCALHAEIGEEALSHVCRLYPRGPRPEGECSCANSCEAVLELFLQHPAPLSFLRIPLTFDLPPQPERSFYFETLGMREDIRLCFIHILQNRSIPISHRLILLEKAMTDVENLLEKKDSQRIREFISSPPDTLADTFPPVTSEHLTKGLAIEMQLLDHIDASSHSVHDFGIAALEWFSADTDLLARYNTANTRFLELFPEWEVFFEHMLVNHVFFSGFPFQDRPISLYDEFLSLCGIYALLRFLCLGWIPAHPSMESVVDVCASAFRLIDHTIFDAYMAHLLRNIHCSTPGQICDLILL